MIVDYIKKGWELLNKISPNNRNIIIILLMGYIFYSLINTSTLLFITERLNQEAVLEKLAEKYTKDTAVEINNLVRLIANKDLEAYDVLLLSYHNSKLSLQGYKYLYLSCLTEAPRSLDTPLLKLWWNNVDYVYYADELNKIHNLGYVYMEDINSMDRSLPKLYHLIKLSEAHAATFFTIEGKDDPVGLIVILYKDKRKVDSTLAILPAIQRLALLLDYENIKK